MEPVDHIGEAGRGFRQVGCVDLRNIPQTDQLGAGTCARDQRLLLGRFQECGKEETDKAVRSANKAFGVWSRMPWRERVRLMRGAAENFRRRKYELGAWLTLEAGKPRLCVLAVGVSAYQDELSLPHAAADAQALAHCFGEKSKPLFRQGTSSC